MKKLEVQLEDSTQVIALDPWNRCMEVLGKRYHVPERTCDEEVLGLGKWSWKFIWNIQ